MRKPLTSYPGHLLCLLFVACIAPGCAGQTTAQERTNNRPNIVLIMADDMGWGWTDFPVRLGQSPDGQDVMYPGTDLWQTPNLRAMADNGLLFSRMYSQSAVCSPTRASALTGRSPERIGITFANTGRLENREVTLAEYASALGYNTGFFGKWHLGVFTRDVQDANRGGRANSHAHYATPLTQGFDVQYATESKTSTFDPGTSGLTTDTRYWTGPGNFIPLDAEELRGDDSAAIVRQANAFMRQAVAEGEPFFTVIWFHTPHLPVNTPNNENVDNPVAFNFAMQDMDAAIGQVRQTLRELGVADDTLVCFTSDNGPENGHDYAADPLRGNKRDLHEGGVRVPGLIEWPNHIEPGVTHTPMVTTDYLPTLLDIWGTSPIDDRPFDGQSMATTLFDDRQSPRQSPIFFKMRSNLRCVIGIDGRYKLISTNGGQDWELYDIVTDYDENDPLITTATRDDGDDATRAMYDNLLQQYTDWQASVQHSRSNGITGDYETRIESSTGVTIQGDAPASLVPGAAQSNTPVLYLERQFITPSDAICQGISIPPLSPHALNSYLLHFDPVDDQPQTQVEIQFMDPIANIVTNDAALVLTDSFAFADPTFERGSDQRHAAITVIDQRTLRFRFDTNANQIGHIRILTRSPGHFDTYEAIE